MTQITPAPRPTCARSYGPHAEQSADARNEAAAGCAQSQVRRRRWSQQFESLERTRIECAVSHDLDGDVITAILALDPHTSRHPPHRRVKEQDRLDRGLHHVDDVVPPADVGEFVSDDRFKLLRRESAESGDGEEHDRPNEAERRGRRDGR
jgi:hypothetical protein